MGDAVFCRQPGTVIGRYDRGISERLVVCRNGLFNQTQNVVRLDEILMMFRFVVRRGDARVSNFVVPSFIETDRESARRLFCGLRQESSYRTAVRSSAQKA